MNVSVKYHLLRPPFLLKGSTDTEFIYRVDSEDETLKFVGCKSRVFNNNLIMLDSKMPNLLSEVIKLCDIRNSNNVNDIIDELENKDPLIYDAPYEMRIYRHKIHEFLKGISLGLEPYDIWYGEPNIYEHLPVFKKNNELIYYSEDNRKFIELLADNLQFDVDNKFPQRTYKIGNEKFLNLKLQISFKT